MNFLSLFCAFLCLTPALAIWPRPQNLTTGSTPLRLSSTIYIKLSGINQTPSDPSDAATRTTNFLKTDKLQALTPDRRASSSSAVHSARTLSSLTLKFNPGATVTSLSSEATQGLGACVNYGLQVPANGGSAMLSANTALGLFRGLTTFGQLWYDLDGTMYTLQAPIQVTDLANFGSQVPQQQHSRPI
ncbi:hypothetical protein P691DRAFT_676214 [Macrolepiota fuliginosa MF-IS2]|uniref:Beta-hexosaminidase eukaryotic type N-terminal domain-containing protein n=1 Tax=Macrolepiota fuliginosa MF-IS2 TaxID=1400762 RepID=A0A9P5X7M3_9AGAR|nr:hypothetical protein P691DRAFT_676214 [Macrolepiota fuliginosa MF-IS2]